MGVRTEQTSQDPLSGSWRANVAAATHSLLSPQPALASLDDVRTVAQADSDAEALEAVLDAMHECGETFASFFRVHDHFSRRRGGQGIVQVRPRRREAPPQPIARPARAALHGCRGFTPGPMPKRRLHASMGLRRSPESA